MSRRKRFVLFVAALVLMVGSVAWGAHHEDYAGMAEAWEAAYNEGSAAAVAAMYVEDGMRMPPHAPVVTGREAIEAQIQQGMEQGLVKIEITTVDSKDLGDEGWARGTWTGMDAEGNTLDSGKWVQIGKKVDGKWYAHFDIWNSDHPMPQ